MYVPKLVEDVESMLVIGEEGVEGFGLVVQLFEGGPERFVDFLAQFCFSYGPELGW